jgi:hypothetical protein
VVFAPRSYAGNRHNTDGRYKLAAERGRFVVMAARSPGVGRVYIDRATRRGLRPDTFAKTAEYCAAELIEDPKFDNNLPKLGWGHSGRGILVGAMALSKHAPFNGLLITDGANLHAPETFLTGFRRMIGQAPRQLPVPEDMQQEVLDFQQSLGKWAERNSRLNGVRALAEAHALGALMCSIESTATMERLAATPALPLRIVFMDQGICGEPAQLESQKKYLERLRDTSLSLLQEGESPAPLTVTIEHGAHSDPENPQEALRHLEETYTLATTAA